MAGGAAEAGKPHLTFSQNAIRCHPSGRTHARGSALKVPTNIVLNNTPFHPLCSRDFTGKRSGTIRTSPNGASSVSKLGDRVLLQHRRILVLERHFHQLRQRIQPRHAVVDHENRLAAGLEHAVTFADQPRRIRRVLHDAVAVDDVERGSRETAAPRRWPRADPRRSRRASRSSSARARWPLSTDRRRSPAPRPAQSAPDRCRCRSRLPAASGPR